MTGDAVFDETRRYRYRLSREWLFGAGICVFIMLNPSTADETVIDPTVRRCVNFAKRWGYRRIEVLNLFAWRSTDPKALLTVADPIGPENDRWITDVATRPTTAQVVCAWGKHGKMLGQGNRVTQTLTAFDLKLWCFGTNGDGTPVHPLYQPNEIQLQRFAA